MVVEVFQWNKNPLILVLLHILSLTLVICGLTCSSSGCLAALQVALQVEGLVDTSSIHSDYTGYREEKTGHKYI